MFKDAEGDVDELAHDRADDAHFWFSSGTKSGSEVLQWGVMFDGHKSRHVESLAQVAVAFFAQASVATHRAAAFFAPWSQASMSSCLASALDLTGTRHLGQKNSGGERADSLNRAKQLVIPGELLVRMDLSEDEFFQVRLLCAECSNDAL